MKFNLLVLLSIFTILCNAQDKIEYLSKSEVENDLKFLDSILQNKSSYQGLNGFDFRTEFDDYLSKIDGRKISKTDFGIFLSNTIGQIGDRHSYIKGYDLPETIYFPLSFAPYNGKVLALEYDRANEKYDFWNSDFPYLKSIINIPIEEILPQILPNEKLAPKKSYLLRSVRDLRDIETVFRLLNKDLPNPLQITLSNKNRLDKKLNIKLVPEDEKAFLWDERFHKKNFFLRDDKSNDLNIIKEFFRIENNIGYIQIVDMLSKEDSPIFFEYLNDFMDKARETDALIIDVRDNGGGTRDLIKEFAGYFVHPDSVYVVNATRQRGKLPLNEELKEDMHNRYLFSKSELNSREQIAVDKFMTSFKPTYQLDDKKFSEYHYFVFNGQKRKEKQYHYDKPIYILANERSFSATSIFVSTFKGLPNIKIAGVNTDGSSGNSQRFELPNSGFRGKISTMVSFQKNGKILDGVGTEPDIEIERSLDQIFLKEDYQLNRLIEIIKTE